MTAFSFRPPAGDPRERVQAKLVLSRMKRMEPLVEKNEERALNGMGRLSAATIEAIRTQFDKRYRNIVGVRVEQRIAFQKELVKIALQGHRKVADLLKEFAIDDESELDSDSPDIDMPDFGFEMLVQASTSPSPSSPPIDVGGVVSDGLH